jgi:hypothetical protein
MQKAIDFLGEQEAREAGLTYAQYMAKLQRFAKRERMQQLVIDLSKPKVMVATAGR